MLIDKINEAIGENTYITTQKLLEIGISKSSISRLVSKGSLVRATRGIYSIGDEFDDIMFLIHNKYKAGVFSHESALYLHGLTDRNPEVHVMTVARNYKINKSEEFKVKFKYAEKSKLQLGIEIKHTDMGNEVPVYNVERTICDIIKNDTKMDSYVVNYALREFALKSKFSKLMIYAKKLGIEKKVRKKMETLL